MAESKKKHGGGLTEEVQGKLMGKELQHLNTKQVSEERALETSCSSSCRLPPVWVLGFSGMSGGTLCGVEALPEPGSCSSKGRVTWLALHCPVCPVQWLLLTELLSCQACVWLLLRSGDRNPSMGGTSCALWLLAVGLKFTGACCKAWVR